MKKLILTVLLLTGIASMAIAGSRVTLDPYAPTSKESETFGDMATYANTGVILNSQYIDQIVVNASGKIVINQSSLGNIPYKKAVDDYKAWNKVNPASQDGAHISFNPTRLAVYTFNTQIPSSPASETSLGVRPAVLIHWIIVPASSVASVKQAIEASGEYVKYKEFSTQTYYNKK